METETFVQIEFDDHDVWGAVEDPVRDEITQFMDEHIGEHHDTPSEDAVSNGVHSILVDYRLAPPDEQGSVGVAFEKAVWKAICRLDNPAVADELWAASAREYMLDEMHKDTAPSVRTVVREELAVVLLAFAKSVNAQLGAEIAVAPGD